MLQSKLFYKTLKEAPRGAEAISHKFLTRGDFIDQSASGIYSFLPLGWLTYQKIEKIVREEITKIGGQEVCLPVLISKNLWRETGRWESIDPPLFKIKDRHGAEFGLGSTHEEAITDLARRRVKSYKDLPFYLFQIQNKFRNEMRASGGLLRVREFIMKDLYSFHASKEDAVKYYQKVKEAYFRIFKRCGIKVINVEADPGTIGGELSHEFMVLSDTGEDKVLVCQKCDFAGNVEKFKNIRVCPRCGGSLKTEPAIEAGHAFYLGTKYSKPMAASFRAKDGKMNPIIMGCYGIGLGRLMATIVEVNHDEKGIIWPKEVAPLQIHLIQIENDKKVKKAALEIYNDLLKNNFEVLYDDREDKNAGEKFIEADLLGLPVRIVISQRTMGKLSAEIKERNKKEIKLVKISRLLRVLKSNQKL